MWFQFLFFQTVLIFFQITSKNEGLSHVNCVYTSAYTLKSLPLLGSDFCIQIMKSYLDKVLEMIKRGQIRIYTLKKKADADVNWLICVYFGNKLKICMCISSGHLKNTQLFYCGSVSKMTLEIKKLIFWCLLYAR